VLEVESELRAEVESGRMTAFAASRQLLDRLAAVLASIQSKD
jgi:hypothetical protein